MLAEMTSFHCFCSDVSAGPLTTSVSNDWADIEEYERGLEGEPLHARSPGSQTSLYILTRIAAAVSGRQLRNVGDFLLQSLLLCRYHGLFQCSLHHPYHANVPIFPDVSKQTLR